MYQNIWKPETCNVMWLNFSYGIQNYYSNTDGLHGLLDLMAKKNTQELTDDLANLQQHTLGIEVKIDRLLELHASGTPNVSRLEVSTSTQPSETETEPEHFPDADRVTVAFVAKHISDYFHSRHLQDTDRHKLSLLLWVAKYESHFSTEDRSLLLSRLQLYAVVVTAGWKTAIKTSKRAELTICGVELQAGDLASQYNRQQFQKRQGNNHQSGRGRGRGNASTTAS